MNREQLIKQFSLKADATDADILAAIADLKAKAKESGKPFFRKESGKHFC
jgi:hypothetical protein